MIPKDPTPHIFSILRDLYGLSEEELVALEPKAIVERIRGIHKGMSAEHEFAAIATWLGNPRLIIHSDEVLATDNHFRVPDFLVVARRGGREIPFLVEVKEEKEEKIKWTEKYLSAMRGFANLLGLPLLVAWKRGRLWALCDSELFEKKNTAFHLSFEKAMKNNLMTMLFGNLIIVAEEGFRFEIENRLVDTEVARAPLLPSGKYETVVTDVGLYTDKGKVSREVTKALFWVFLAAATDESSAERQGEFIRQKWPTNSEEMFNASDILFTRLSWASSGESVDWLLALRKGLVKPTFDLRTVLQSALELGAIRYVLEQQPEKIPAFLEGTNCRLERAQARGSSAGK